MSKLDELDKEIVAGLIHNFSLPEGLIEIQEEEYDDLAKVIKEIVNPAIKQARLEEREALKKLVEGKRKELHAQDIGNGVYIGGFNDALSDLINELK